MKSDEDIDEAEASSYAEQWFAIADADGNGLIDLEEFIEFVEKLDESKSISDSEVKNQFENHDTSEKNALDKIEFGVALHSLIKLLKAEIEKVEEGEEEDDA